MNISGIAAKQKRILEWKEFLELTQVPSDLKEKIANTLEVYGKVLIDCWKAGSISEEMEHRMLDIERELIEYNERVRLLAPQTLPRI